MILREINNTDQPVTSPGGTLQKGVRITARLIVDNKPTDVLDVITGETIVSIEIPVKTDDKAEFKISLWPNSRGHVSSLYQITIHAETPITFNVAVPEGDLSPIKWIDLIAPSFRIPLSSGAYETPLLLTAGDTVPVTGLLADNAGDPLDDITDYVISLDVTDSLNATESYQVQITDALAAKYEIDLSALDIGRYLAKLRVVNSIGQSVTFQAFLIEVSA